MTGIPDSGLLAFQVLRNGSPFGTHRLTFNRTDDTLTVTIAVNYTYQLGFITLFRYKLRCTELWQGGVLMSAESKTDDNGKPAWMRAARDSDGLEIEGSKSGRYRAPAGSILASHWNKAQLDAPMINPQDGDLLRYQIEPRGSEQLADRGGKIRTASRFSLTGKDGLDLWYDADGIWASLRAKVRDGSTIRYLRSE